MLQCPEHGLPARHGTKTNATGEVRQKTADSLMLGEQFLEIGIVRRPSERVDLCHCRFHQLRGDGGEDGFPEFSVADFLVENHSASCLQGQSGGIEIAQPPQPRGPTLLNGVRPDFRHDHVEQIEHVILGARFKRPDERQQSGSSSLVRHPADRLRFGGIGKPREGKDSRLWQFVSVWQTFGQFSNFVEAFDRPRKFGHALQHRSRSKPIHRTLPSVPRDDHQGVETFLAKRLADG